MFIGEVPTIGTYIQLEWSQDFSRLNSAPKSPIFLYRGVCPTQHELTEHEEKLLFNAKYTKIFCLRKIN